ncbi:hypothetical protein QZH41_018356 [Actinostola sp. cb2023]|nr:hypothetical protein QZH41_018356 [Actinostola sp. cb2023]
MAEDLLSRKPLRTNTALLLIAHVTFCDIILGIYTVAIGDCQGLVAKGLPVFRQWCHELCPYYRTVFVLGQIMEVATLLLVTTERYLAIVFCMNPSARVTKKKRLDSLVPVLAIFRHDVLHASSTRCLP